MPIYEYRCEACGFQKEFLQRISDKVLTDCPECGKRSLSKMVTAAGFQLKGSGWYATDFKNKGGSKPSETKAGDAPKKDEPKKDEPKKDEPKAAGAASTSGASTSSN